MDAMDILGGLLGGKSAGAGGLGGEILKDILSRGSRGSSSTGRSAPSRRSSAGQETDRSGPRQRRGSIDEQAEALEDLLNVANDSHQNHRRRSTESNPSYRTSRSRSRSDDPSPLSLPKSEGRNHQQPDSLEPASEGSSGGAFPIEPSPRERPSAVDPFSQDRESQNQRALVLIRAMVHAIKSDGKLTPEEQRGLLEYVGDTSPDAVRFLQNEFNQPLDAKEFAWSVPLGMEEQVYTMSVAAIHLDQQTEAAYLKELAHGLRLPPTVCNAIHQRHNAPTIF